MIKSIILSIVLLLCKSAVVFADNSPTQDELKALYLFNFSYFVTFPEQCQQSCNFTICTSSESDVTGYLETVTKGEKLEGKPIIVHAITESEQLIFPTCQILFVNKNDEQYLYSILESLKNKPVLTVSDIEDFTAKGGMIGFDFLKRRLTPVVNNSLANRHKLKLDSKLLSISRVVQE
jgi:hypothetical protein